MSPRIKPTTTYTPRTKLSTTYSKPRDNSWVQYFTADNTTIMADTTLYTADVTILSAWGKLTTSYTTPRYWKYLEDLLGNNIFDLVWNQVQWISGKRTNKIDTFYT